MKIITWNISFLPKNLNLLRNPNKVIFKVVDKCLEKNAYCINLQELYDYNLQKKIKEIFNNNNYNCYTSNKKGFISENGLLTAVNDNIIKTHEYFYKNKGVLYTPIKKGIITVETENGIFHNTQFSNDILGNFKLDYFSNFRKIQYDEINSYLSKFDKEKLNVISGVFNEDFDDDNFLEFIHNIPFKNKKINNNKIITYPKSSKQLDYIIINKNLNLDFEIDNNNLSNHYLLSCYLNATDKHKYFILGNH